MKPLLRTLTILAVMLAVLPATAQDAYGEVRGIIKNSEGEAVPFAVIKVLQGTQLVGGTTADIEGNYKYKPLRAGAYEIVVSDPGHQTQPVNKISIIPNEATYVNVTLKPNLLEGVTVVADPIDYTQSGVDPHVFIFKSIDGKELHDMAGYESGNIKGVLETISSEVVQSPNGDIHVRGARDGATGYYVDGVKTLSLNRISGLAIENLTFFSGGVPAMYGDQTSGAVMITTKSYFSGIREKNIRLAQWREEEAANRAWKKEQEEKRLKERDAVKSKDNADK